MPTWSDDQSYKKGFTEIVVPLAEKFKPQIILVSMGYDAHWMDHSSVLGLTVNGYYDLTKSIKDLASALLILLKPPHSERTQHSTVSGTFM